MRIMGFDISSTSSGFSVVDYSNDKTILVDFGLIRGDSSMTPTQRLYFQGNEIKKIIEKFNPDEIGIEETVLVRGPKIMRTLARFSGVAIFQSYSYQKKELYFFEPAKWKKYLGVGGNATKAEIQLEICSRFNKLSSKQLDTYREKVKLIEQQVADCKIECKKQNIKNRKEVNKKVREIEKQYDKMSTDIFSDCGISNDIADSISVALAVVSEMR